MKLLALYFWLCGGIASTNLDNRAHQSVWLVRTNGIFAYQPGTNAVQTTFRLEIVPAKSGQEGKKAP